MTAHAQDLADGFAPCTAFPAVLTPDYPAGFPLMPDGYIHDGELILGRRARPPVVAANPKRVPFPGLGPFPSGVVATTHGNTRT